MADDGMLLNFSIPEGPLNIKPSFKGGRWKDRLTAKKAALHNQAKRRRASAQKDTPDEASKRTAPQELVTRDQPRVTKRQRVNGDFQPSASSREQTAAKPAGVQQANVHPRQVISSLFTYNPTAKTVPKRTPDAEPEGPVEPSNAPLNPELESFTMLGLSATMASHLFNKMEIKAPTGIQKTAVPQLLKENTDAFIQAETGSGKTLSYLLPIVQRIMALSPDPAASGSEVSSVKRDSGLFAIILAPTRELSKQIAVVLESLLRCAHWIVPGTVIGGEKKKSEKARLRRGLNILVATPGRLADHLDNTKALDVSDVRWLVLDEGDRLMELGFEEEIQKIVSKLDSRMSARANIPGLPTKRTTILCSATMKMGVQRLGEISLKDAVHIQADPKDKENGSKAAAEPKAFSAPAQLQQSYAIVPPKQRLATLVALLKKTFARKGACMKAIVFVSCADSVDFHFEALTRQESNAENPDKEECPDEEARRETKKNYRRRYQERDAASMDRTSAPSPAISGPDNPITIHKLHGSLPQAIRTSTLSSFAKSKTPALLICTDVASRGLDLPDIDFVVEYDPSFSKDDHLHRVGRTARAGRDGRALIFLMPGDEEGYISILKESRHGGGKALTRHDATEILQKGFCDNVGVVSKNPAWEDRATEWQLDIERWALENPKALEQARRAYQSHVRAYATHVAAEREIFNIKNLHLGHLAKAFALRDKPGSIKVPGLRQNATTVMAEKKKGTATGARRKREGEAKGAGTGRPDSGIPNHAEVDEARAKMRKMGRMLGAGVDEFNLG